MITAVLKEIILDFQREILETGVKRHLDYEIVKDKVFICIGVRRCGKSTLLRQIVDDLLKKQNVRIDNIIYINFFDDRLNDLRKGELQPILDAYFSLYPYKKSSEEIYFFFDEIQEVKNWELFVERLKRTEKCSIFLSGSSAKMLSKDISTQMRGRSLSWELFPFSFLEFLDYNKCDYSVIDSKTRYLIVNYFDEYFKKGGFPEIFDKSDKIRVFIHQEYYKSILHRDIIERYDVAHPQAVLQIGFRLMTSVSNLYTINRLTEYIKSFGYKVSKSFVSDCIQWFEDAFYMFSVKICSLSINIQNTNPKKIYCIDHGLIRSVSLDIQEKEGFMLENIVFLHLRRRYSEIYYYKTKNGSEIDFIYKNETQQQVLIQVCYKIGTPETEKRETKAILEAMDELNITEAFIITYNEENTIKMDERTINVIPAWRFLIS